MAVRIAGRMVCHIDDGGQGMWVKWLRIARGRRWRTVCAAR